MAVITREPSGVLTDWIAFWKIWVVGDVVVYGLCPMWARLPVNHIFSFAYICVLSFMRGANEPEAAKPTVTKPRIKRSASGKAIET